MDTFADQTNVMYRSNTTTDVYEHQQALSKWSMEYDQMSSGPFQGYVDELYWDDIQLIRDRANQSILKRGCSWPGSVTFNVPLHSAGDTFYCEGKLSSFGSFLMAPGDQLPEIQTPACLDVVCASVCNNTLQGHLISQGIEFDVSERTRLFSLKSHDHNHNMSNFLRNLYQQNNINVFLRSRNVRNNLRDGLFQYLIDVLDSNYEIQLSSTARKRIVDKARQYVLSRHDHPPTILELCNEIGTSRRKLQYCFHENLGINPVAFLRLVRLNAAHRDLITESHGAVQDVAARWGFLHLSRFASEYRQLFAELPSETLKKHSI